MGKKLPGFGLTLDPPVAAPDTGSMLPLFLALRVRFGLRWLSILRQWLFLEKTGTAAANGASQIRWTLAKLALIGGLFLFGVDEARAQTCSMVWEVTTATSVGACPNTFEQWPTFEQAAATEFAACLANGAYIGDSLGSCSPSGAPSASATFSNCAVNINGSGPGNINVWASSACPMYWVAAPQSINAETCSANCFGDPINPSAGNVFKKEDDVAFAGGIGSPGFQRFYNSTDATGTDMGVGWRHSYDRSILVNYNTTNATVYPGSGVVSPQYSTALDACTQGFAAIQASVNGWQSASATYTNNTCVISTASGTIATLPINTAFISPPATNPVEYDVTRDDGQVLRYTTQNGTISNPPGISLRLAQIDSGFTLTDDADTVESYNANGVLQSITTRAGIVQTVAYDGNGHLLSVTDSFGRSLTISRNTQGSIAKVTASGGGFVQYGYDGNLRLQTVTNLDTTTRSYLYGNPSFPNALTGEIDESGTQLNTWSYDSQGRGLTAQEALGADATSLVYNSDGTVTITDALGAVRTVSYTRIGDINRVISISGSQCPTCQEPAATTYDGAGWVASRTDYNGNLTCYANDPVRGLELVRVEGFAPGNTCPANLSSYTPQTGTAQRKITTQWSSTWREPALITEANRTTAFTFDGSGNVHTKTVTDLTVTPNVARTWTYTYTGYGQVLTAKGPRTDVNSTTTYTYYTCTTGAQCGQVETSTNAVGQLTTFNTYNAYGQPLTITDPNNILTTRAYDARERLTSRQVGTETTSYSYWPIGLVKLVTLPDSGTVQLPTTGRIA